MTARREEIAAVARSYILEEFLPDEDAEELEDSTPLISGGILDSIATVKLVSHLEETFGVEFQAHEVSADTLDTISQMAELVAAKLADA